jgi:Uma2 family endonuclease
MASEPELLFEISVVEVLSPHSKRIDRIKQPPRYRDFGVPEYWVVDPFARAIERYRLAADAALEIYRDVLAWQPSADAPALALDVPSVFPAQ